MTKKSVSFVSLWNTQNVLKDEARTPTNITLIKLKTKCDETCHPTQSQGKRSGNTWHGHLYTGGASARTQAYWKAIGHKQKALGSSLRAAICFLELKTQLDRCPGWTGSLQQLHPQRGKMGESAASKDKPSGAEPWLICPWPGLGPVSSPLSVSTGHGATAQGWEDVNVKGRERSTKCSKPQ